MEAVATEDRLERVPLCDIALITGLNCRERVLLKDLAEMIESVKEKGVIQPILVRPSNGGTERPYQLVAGERRYRSALKVFGDEGLIPAMVREMTDDEAHELMLIENLQRRRLTPLEEARSFKDYVDRHGDAGVEQLSDRVKITATRINRRIAILRLPDQILKAWDEGEIQFGALEELLRVSHDTAADIYEWFLQELEYGRRPGVDRIAGRISQVMLRLSGARFNTGEICAACPKNSQVQLDLFGMKGPDKVVCFDQECFLEHQKAHFAKHWTKTQLAREHGTTRAVFEVEVPHSTRKGIYRPTAEACLACEHYVSVLYLDGQEYMDRACIGPEACYLEKYSQEAHSSGLSSPEPDEVSRAKKFEDRRIQHGRDARALFYLEGLRWAVPAFLKNLYGLPEGVDPKDGDAVAEHYSDAATAHREYVMRLSIFGFYTGHRAEMAAWLAKRLDLADADTDEDHRWYALEDEDVIDALADMHEAELIVLLDHMGVWLVTQEQKVSDHTREHLGVRWYGMDIACTWEMTEEFLKRKQKAELMDLVKRMDLYAEPKFMDYLHNNYQIDVIDGLKKTQMVDAILDCGVEMRGFVPDEVIKDPREE